MNSIDAVSIMSPHGKTENCAKFIIEDNTFAYHFPDRMMAGYEYTFSCWIRSESTGSITVGTTTHETSEEWTYRTFTFTAESSGLVMIFAATGTYYIYHSQLELGNRATDWTPAPEDIDADVGEAHDAARNAQDTADGTAGRLTTAESTIQQLVNNISMLVVDKNGQSLMSQTSDGWTFSTAAIGEQIQAASDTLSELVTKMGSTDAAIKVLSNSVDEFGIIAEYVHIGSYTYVDEIGVEQTEPSIDLFETDTGFKLKITNTRIVFTDGTTELLTVNSKSQSLTAPKVSVRKELEIGGNDYTNLVRSSIDTDGRVFNGIGYRDGYTLDSETGELVESETESVTGFIPFQPNLLLYIYGTEWLKTERGHICLYDPSFGFIDDLHFGLAGIDEFAPGLALTQLIEKLRYDTPGYIRISGYGPGSKFIVTFGTQPQDSWVWKQRSNGNLGLVWKEVT